MVSFLLSKNYKRDLPEFATLDKCLLEHGYCKEYIQIWGRPGIRLLGEVGDVHVVEVYALASTYQ